MTEERLRAAATIRQAVRVMFDEIELEPRDTGWVNKDSFDLGIVTAAKFLLDRADQLEAGAL